jgi:hypothetical protein
MRATEAFQVSAASWASAQNRKPVAMTRAPGAGGGPAGDGQGAVFFAGRGPGHRGRLARPHLDLGGVAALVALDLQSVCTRISSPIAGVVRLAGRLFVDEHPGPGGQLDQGDGPPAGIAHHGVEDTQPALHLAAIGGLGEGVEVGAVVAQGRVGVAALFRGAGQVVEQGRRRIEGIGGGEALGGRRPVFRFVEGHAFVVQGPRTGAIGLGGGRGGGDFLGRHRGDGAGEEEA